MLKRKVGLELGALGLARYAFPIHFVKEIQEGCRSRLSRQV